MNVFFDVDSTIISWDGRLRPHVEKVFSQLNQDGHSVYIWSGNGLRWSVIDDNHLRPYVKNCYVKPEIDHFNDLRAVGIDVTPDLVVDDHPEVTDFFGGIAVKPYVVAHPSDRELERVYAQIAKIGEPGRSTSDHNPAE